MKKTHLDNLLESFPNILNLKILDLGAGRGSFLIEVTKRGGVGKGVEYKQENVNFALEKAEKLGIKLEITQGRGECLPYQDKLFGFVNICEVIEHVEDPQKMLEETYRVLEDGGSVYLSIPNRYSLKDPHFHLYLINWMPRMFADRIINFLGRDKTYDGSSGFQRLSEMHYFTYNKIFKLVGSIGFKAYDIREIKIKKRVPKILLYPALLVYKVARTLKFDSFHLKLLKNDILNN